ncbi:MAG: serine/threonine protein kinase [Sandaracinaceae bacterium]|nr:serine/threonine protein kinase [Sandaracinaceae bacterium]
MFSVGDKIGVYEIIAELKSGGMATLFLGRREGAAGFAKLVAIKVVHPHLAEDPTFVQMFVDEALLSARIEHPNVVHVEELRELEGNHFLVMEYVHGCSLGQLVRSLARLRRRLSPELAIHVAIKVADGLHAAHEVRDEAGQPLGVVHRDVSPQNILLSYQGNVKLIDFGVAKVRGRVQETAGGSIKGKFRYMSPEHASAKDLDRRSDVYALGVVLWETLTMRRRFEGASDLDVLAAVRRPDVVPPSRHAPGLPRGLDEVVLRAMAIAPGDRFQTARELRDALVEVSPRAAALHESALGTLLSAVMTDRIEADRTRLASQISGLTLDLPRPVAPLDDALATMTLGAEELELMLESGDTGDDLVGAHEAATVVLEEATVASPGPPRAPPPPPALDPALVAARASAPPPSLAVAPPEGVRVHPAVLVAGALVLLLGTGGASFLLMLRLLAPSPDAPASAVLVPPPVGTVPPGTAAAPAELALDAGVEDVDASVELAGEPAGETPPEPEPSPRGRARGRRDDASATPGRRSGSGRARPIASEW